MSNDVFDSIKRDEQALRRAYTDAGGKGGDGRYHNHCPICSDDTGFMLLQADNGFWIWACYAGKGNCAIPPGKKHCGTIIDFLRITRNLDDKAACVLALDKYGAKASSNQTPETTNPKPKKQGKLWGDAVQALEAAKFGIAHRPRVTDVRLKTFAAGEIAPAHAGLQWFAYCGADGEPKLIVARFNIKKKAADGADKEGKEFAPIHRDGNGWRVGLGGWGKAGKLCPLYNLPGILKAVHRRDAETQRKGTE